MRLVISIKSAIYVINFRIENVSIKGKTMTGFIVSWKLSSKSINWELFVLIIIFKNVQAGIDSVGVSICSGLWVDIM